MRANISLISAIHPWDWQSKKLLPVRWARILIDDILGRLMLTAFTSSIPFFVDFDCSESHLFLHLD